MRRFVGILWPLVALASIGCGNDATTGSPSGSGGASASASNASGTNASTGSGSSGAGGAGGMATFPIAIAADKNHFVDATGKPFLLRGDTAWSLMAELSDVEVTQYLDDRAARGFNTLLVNLVEPAFSSHTPPWRDAAGDAPFDDADDFSQTNEAYFAHVDAVLAEAEKRGMLVLLVPAYIGYGCGAEGWCAHMQANGVAKLTQYGEFVGTRYRDTKNILWVNGGDHTPSTAGNPSEMDLVNAVRAGVATGDQDGHYHTAHWSSETSAGDVSVPWLDVDTTYTYTAPHLYEKLYDDHDRDAGVMPFFLIESGYENEHQMSARDLRSEMYEPVLAGAAGFVFGNYPMWSFWDPGDPNWFLDDGGFPGGWPTALASPGSKSASIAGAFFASHAFETLVPDTTNAVLVDGGMFGSDAYAMLAASADGKRAIVYLTTDIEVTIDLSKMAGPTNASWFDPSTGMSAGIAGSPFANGGMQTFTPAATNGDGSSDWVLVLEAN